MSELECFYDCSSPWTYFAFESLLRMQDEIGVTITWRPFLVGGVFNAVNPTVHNNREKPVPSKQAYGKKDQQDWARHLGLPIHYRPTVFPVNSVKAMRACILLAPEGKLVPFARAAFEAYFGADEDISQDAVLEGVCRAAGVDPARVLAGIGDPAIKAALKANTDELIARGGFGSPTTFVGERDMYFGNDRLGLVREALLRRRARV